MYYCIIHSVFKEMKALLHCGMSSMKGKIALQYYIFKGMKWKILLQYLYTSESNGEYYCNMNYIQMQRMNENILHPHIV